ncbi:hypothetical protein OIV83_005771 [Microbotryomycetes sp. JL201]|nr:hypothetical protein OIV83_005771 [Microbotryomycetes sp. JL201]
MDTSLAVSESAPEPAHQPTFQSVPTLPIYQPQAYGSALPPHPTPSMLSNAYAMNVPQHALPSRMPPGPPPLPPLPTFASTTMPPSSSEQTPHFSSLEAPFDPLADLTMTSDLLTFFHSLDPAMDAVNGWSPLVTDVQQHHQQQPTSHFPTSALSTPIGSMQQPPFSNPVGDATPTIDVKGPQPMQESTLHQQHVVEPDQAKTSAAVADHDEAELIERHQVKSIYRVLNEGFFSSLPQPVRQILNARMDETAFSTALGKSACMALCLLYRARMLDDEQSVETRQKLIKQSTHYYQKAVDELCTQSGRNQIPLEASLLAVLDMHLFSLEEQGAAAGYAILLIGDAIITQSLGGPHPTLDLTSEGGPLMILLRSFAYVDTLRNFCLFNKRRCLFDLTCAPASGPDGSRRLPKQFPTNSVKLMGLPVGLLLCLASIVNLSVDKDELLDEQLVQERSKVIETSIREWQPADPRSDQALQLDSVRLVDDVVTQEMWRHTALVTLYQMVHGYGPMHPPLRESVDQIIALGSRTTPPFDYSVEPAPAAPLSRPTPTESTSATAATGTIPSTVANGVNVASASHHMPMSTMSERACPWFVAATNCVTALDRSLCKQALSRSKPEHLSAENVRAVEKIWELTDERGWFVDWRRALDEHGMFVAFT